MIGSNPSRQLCYNAIMDHSIVFMGSPSFAVPSLEALIASYNIAGVITQPDRRAGRGRNLQAPPIKEVALAHNISVLQPTSLRKDKEAMNQLRSWDPELIVVAAFGQILRQDVLELPVKGCVNVHASLLPRWRGAAPINAAILHGDEQTGITIMLMDEGIDTGPILSQRSTPITTHDDAAALSDRLSRIGAELLIETLPQYLSGDITPRKQEETKATYAPMLSKKDGELDFGRSAEYLARQVRAYHPWPGSFTTWNNNILKVLHAHAVSGAGGQAGKKAVHQGLPAIQTKDGLLVLDEVQPAGKKASPGKNFLLGARDWGK